MRQQAVHQPADGMVEKETRHERDPADAAGRARRAAMRRHPVKARAGGKVEPRQPFLHRAIVLSVIGKIESRAAGLPRRMGEPRRVLLQRREPPFEGRACSGHIRRRIGDDRQAEVAGKPHAGGRAGAQRLFERQPRPRGVAHRQQQVSHAQMRAVRQGIDRKDRLIMRKRRRLVPATGKD